MDKIPLKRRVVLKFLGTSAAIGLFGVARKVLRDPPTSPMIFHLDALVGVLGGKDFVPPKVGELFDLSSVLSREQLNGFGWFDDSISVLTEVIDKDSVRNLLFLPHGVNAQHGGCHSVVKKIYCSYPSCNKFADVWSWCCPQGCYGYSCGCFWGGYLYTYVYVYNGCCA